MPVTVFIGAAASEGLRVLERAPGHEMGEALVGLEQRAPEALARLVLAAELAQHQALGDGDEAGEARPDLQELLRVRERRLQLRAQRRLLRPAQALRGEVGIGQGAEEAVATLRGFLPVAA